MKGPSVGGMRFRAAIASVAILLLRDPAAGVVGEDTLPEAHWISAGTHAETGGASFFRKRFVAPPRLAKAVLLGTCDEKMRVWINAREVATLAGFDRASTRDVTAHLLPGENLIAVRVENKTRLPALRIMLELATDVGRQLWVVSDPSWICFDAEAEGWRSGRFDAAQWRPAFAHGSAGISRWGNVFHPTRSPDGYNSWMLASAAPEATHPATINCPPGFRVELLRSAQPDEGSWIALAFDPRGRITVARERRGLVRFALVTGALANPELIDDTLLECRGLLYAYGALYVNANNSRGFYRLRDTDGDDRFDTRDLLLHTGGGVGHGRNQIKLGPDGLLYLVHGNDVVLPAEFAPHSSFAHSADDQLFPMRWGEHGSSSDVRPPHGHILQTDPEGKNWRIVAGGLRNALDVAFNQDGEMFTYDADNERDIATPWYRPTRVLHVVPGAEYGWRRGAGKFPAYVEDLWPSVVDVGVGSPCGIEFGTGARFPAPYRGALFIADWAYGRILAVHLSANGASYDGRIEPFISGRPLNVTDLTFGPDGAMYFLTGGRGTQSGLYRVSYAGELDETPRHDATPERHLRRRMEALHSVSPSVALEAAWAELGSNDRAVRNAARLVVERQPVAEWEEKALAEPEPDKALGALLALSRVGGTVERHARLLSRILELPLETLSADRQLRAARVCALSFARIGKPVPEKGAEVARRFSRLYPAESTALNHELCRLLVYLQAPQVVEKTVPLLSAAKSPEDLLHYLWHLRQVSGGWNLQHRRIVFEALQRADAHQGARDYLQALRDTRKQFTEALSSDEQAALAGIIAPRASSPTQLPIDYAKYQFNKVWRLEDFSTADFATGGDITRGREAFIAAQCAHCHRVGDDPGGSGGPDLANVGARFGGRDLLGQILEPSKVVDEKYRAIDVFLSSGGTFFGTVESEDDDKLDLSIGWNAPDVITLRKSEIARRSPSERSLMPDGLVNVLNRQQIRDLLAYLQASRAER